MPFDTRRWIAVRVADMLATRNQVHDDLPAWDGLLQVYGALYLPVIFGLLFELNLDAWVSARINYEVSISQLRYLPY